MGADAAGYTSLTVPELQRQLAELGEELRFALQREKALAEILSAINDPDADVSRVFSVMIESATKLCSAAYGYVWLYDGERARPAASYAQQPFGDWLRQRESVPNEITPLGQTLLHHRLVHVVDATAHEGYRASAGFRELVDRGGVRTLLHVPLSKGEKLLGVITVYRQERRPFSDRQIALMESFAAQAVIAMENARLLNQLRERTQELTTSFEYQSATSAVLSVISRSPTDAQPVFDVIAERTVRLCAAEGCHVYRHDGELIHFMASHGHSAAGQEAMRRHYPRRPDRGTAAARAILSGRIEQIPDVHADAEYTSIDVANAMKINSVAAVPMLKNGRPVGAIALVRAAKGMFPQRQIELLQTFADQAVIAINNVELFEEVQARARDLQEALEQQTATADILRVISQSPTDVTPVLTAVAKAALKFCGARDAQVALRDGDTWSVAAHEGPIGALHGTRRLNRQTAPGRAMVDGQVVQIADLHSSDAEEFQEGRELGTRLGFRSALAAPLLRDDVAIGAISLRRPEAGAFAPNQVELLKSFAAQSVIAIENVRLFTELRDSLERLKAAQANLIQAEKMASLGQLTAGIAHEIKNPLNFVNNFAGLSSELLDELKQAVDTLLAEPDEEKRAEVQETMELLTGNLAKIVEHGKRADGIVKSMLSHSRGGTGDWQEANINALVEEALNLAYHGARAQDKDFNVTLERDFAREVRLIEVVPQDVTRVFLNLFGNAFYATSKRHISGLDAGYRPTVTVSTRDVGEVVEIRVRDNGTGIPPEVRARLFQPFFTTKPTGEGTGLGLSISYDIVTQQHGGTIEVESEPGSFTEFTMRLPRSRRAAQPRGAS